MKEPAHSLDQLLELLGRRAFLLWMAGQGVLVVGIIAFAKMVKILHPAAKHSPSKRLVRGVAYGCIRYATSTQFPHFSDISSEETQ